MDDNTKPRCHSCGITLTEELYGTNADETLNKDFCKFCYKNGKQTGFAPSLLEILDKVVEDKVKDSNL